MIRGLPLDFTHAAHAAPPRETRRPPTQAPVLLLLKPKPTPVPTRAPALKNTSLPTPHPQRPSRRPCPPAVANAHTAPNPRTGATAATHG